MNLINLLLCAIKTSLSYYRPGIMRGLLSSLLCSCWQNAMRPWHKPIFFAQLQRWGENWQGTAVEWRERRDRETCQKSQRVKSYPGRRETGHGTRGRHTPRLCLLCLYSVVVVAISNCQLSMNLQKYKQTDRGAGCGLQCSLSGSQRARRGGPAQKSLACSPACLPAWLVLPYASSVSGQGTSDCTLGLELPMLPAWLRPELCKSNGTYRCQLQYYCCNSAVCQAKQSIETGKGRGKEKGLRSLNRLWALPACG